MTGCGVADSAPVMANENQMAASTFIFECGRAKDPLQEPPLMALDCQRGEYYLEGLTWRGWGSSEAYADGRLTINKCIENCTLNDLIVVQVEVMAWGRSFGEATSSYTRILVRIKGDVPPGEIRERNYNVTVERDAPEPQLPVSSPTS